VRVPGAAQAFVERAGTIGDPGPARAHTLEAEAPTVSMAARRQVPKE